MLQSSRLVRHGSPVRQLLWKLTDGIRPLTKSSACCEAGFPERFDTYVRISISAGRDAGTGDDGSRFQRCCSHRIRSRCNQRHSSRFRQTDPAAYKAAFGDVQGCVFRRRHQLVDACTKHIAVLKWSGRRSDFEAGRSHATNAKLAKSVPGSDEPLQNRQRVGKKQGDQFATKTDTLCVSDQRQARQAQDLINITLSTRFTTWPLCGISNLKFPNFKSEAGTSPCHQAILNLLDIMKSGPAISPL